MRVRATVESMNYSACGLAVGDWFEVGPDGLRLPLGQGFCYFAIGAVLPLVAWRFDVPDAGEWLASRPLVACPDPPENVLMRLELVEE